MALLQTFCKQAQTVAIEPQTLNDVSSPAPKDEDMTGERLLLQDGLNLRTESIEAATKISHASSQPDLGPCGKMDHLRRLSRTQRKSAGSAPLSTLIIARPDSSI